MRSTPRVARVDNEAPYFVDMVGQEIAEKFPGLTAAENSVDVHTTLDINLQRLALDAVRDGLGRVDDMLGNPLGSEPGGQRIECRSDLIELANCGGIDRGDDQPAIVRL